MIEKNDLIKTLNDPLKSWSDVPHETVGQLLGEAAADMVGFDQRNPHHCYTLFEHCLHTADFINSAAENISTDPDPVKTAALLHDIAKPIVAFEKNKRLVFYGHAKKSADIARSLLPRLGFDDNETRYICFLIGHHDDFISYVLPDEDHDKNNRYLIEITRENVLKHIGEVSDNAIVYPQKNVWNDLLLLCCADASPQSEFVFMNGVQTDSKEHKLIKLKAVREIIKNYM